jgi:hypothetical protein
MIQFLVGWVEWDNSCFMFGSRTTKMGWECLTWGPHLPSSHIWFPFFNLCPNRGPTVDQALLHLEAPARSRRTQRTKHPIAPACGCCAYTHHRSSYAGELPRLHARLPYPRGRSVASPPPLPPSLEAAELALPPCAATAPWGWSIVSAPCVAMPRSPVRSCAPPCSVLLARTNSMVNLSHHRMW